MRNKNFVMTEHARKRAQEMGVTNEELRRVLKQPERVTRNGGHQNRDVYAHGRVAAIVQHDGTVITLIWNRFDYLVREEPLP